MKKKKTAKNQRAQWSYPLAFNLVAILIALGFFTQYLLGGQKVSIATYPSNLYALLCFVGIIISLHCWIPKNPAIVFLSSIPATISALVGTLILVFIMGTVLQVDQEGTTATRLGVHSITQSWAFALILLYLLTILSFVTLRRLTPFSWKNSAFFLNHFGLLLAISAALVGSADIETLRMHCVKGDFTWHASKDGHSKEVDIAVKLNDFDIKFYPAKLSLVNNQSGHVIYDDKRIMPDIASKEAIKMGPWTIKITKHLSHCAPFGGKYHPINEKGSTEAVYITATKAQQKVSGWLSYGSYRFPYQSLKLDEEHSLIMTIPEAKEFISKLEIRNPTGEKIETELRVNQAVQFSGWKIYQVSYDERFGRDSDTSILEITRDPWLPVVYTGIYLMIAGAISLIFLTNNGGKYE